MFPSAPRPRAARCAQVHLAFPPLLAGPRARQLWSAAPGRYARRCATALALACCVATARAEAQGPTGSAATDASSLDLARSVAVTGREAFNSGDYETALALFRRAYALFPAPTVVLYEARTLEKMGLLIEAVNAYARTATIPIAADAPPQFAEAADLAREEGDALRARIPTLVLEVRGASVGDPNLVVTINGQAQDTAKLGRAQRLNPGTYRIEGSVGNLRQATAEVTLVPGQSRRVELSLADLTLSGDAALVAGQGTVGAERSGRHPIPTLAYVAGGVGIVGASAGVITGLLANKKYDDAERLCEDHRCPAGSPGVDAVDAFRTWRMISSVSYGVGAAGIAAGVVLWLTGSEADEPGQSGSIEPWGTAKTAGIRGTF